DFLPGTGGLEIMHLSAWLDAPLSLASGSTNIVYQDNNYQERLGWREIIARAGNGIALQNSNVPQTDISQELTTYPADLLSNPRNDREASFGIVPNSGTATMPSPATAVTSGALGAFDRTRDDFAKLITTNQELSLSVLALSFLAAIALGGLHAFSPGHGKAVVGAYLVGSRGNWQHAVFLGFIVTATHTAGVYALGFVTLFLSAYFLPEQLFPWLGFISGMLVAVIGVRLFVSRIRAARSQDTPFGRAMKQAHAHDYEDHHEHAPVRLATARPAYAGAGYGTVHQHEAAHVHTHADGTTHSHSHEDKDSHGNGNVHSHYHEHLHGNGHSHSHDLATPEEEAAHVKEHLAEIEALEKPSWRNLVSLGISGGLLPCPSALVVMLSAIALGRVLYGLFLIVGFSLGLAGVLVGTGLVMLYAGKMAGRVFAGRGANLFFRYVPILGAGFVTLLGVAIAFDAFFQTGFVP
ncbi:MAG TPA: sulfite exporter TauE/SafE family protein, partial [Anaerolineae bacterium]|nr:sulfite exporter TauE/SafE family protein [Anaerolineae bacterium]